MAWTVTNTEVMNLEQQDDYEMKFEDYCEKVFVTPMYEREKKNDAIEREIKHKLQGKGITVRT